MAVLVPALSEQRASAGVLFSALQSHVLLSVSSADPSLSCIPPQKPDNKVTSKNRGPVFIWGRGK